MGDGMTAPTYPGFICAPCGEKHGRHAIGRHGATWHRERCDICGKLDWLTEPRDFGSLRETWNDDVK